MRPSIQIKNTIVPLNSVTITHHSSSSHPTMSSTSNDDKLIYNTSNKPSSSTSNVVLDLLTTFKNTIIPSTNFNNIESTSPVTTTKQQFLFTKSPVITEENTKFQTFQSVQETVTTTTSSPTTVRTKSPSRRPTTTTSKPTKRHRPTAGIVANDKPEKETSSTTKKTVRVTTTTAKPITTTRRPSTTTIAPTVPSKRPITSAVTKPTRRVTESTVRPLINRNATAPASRPTVTSLLKDPVSSNSVDLKQTTHKPIITSTTSQPFVTISYVETTKVPRPKPKPTKQIVKVSPTSLDHLLEVEIPLSTTQSVVSSVTSTASPLPTVEQVDILTSSSTLFMETKTESSVNENRPVLAYNESSAENEIKPIVGQTTQRPILVTWSNIQTQNNDTDNGNNSDGKKEQKKIKIQFQFPIPKLRPHRLIGF